jgi:hypothetical protein
MDDTVLIRLSGMVNLASMLDLARELGTHMEERGFTVRILERCSGVADMVESVVATSAQGGSAGSPVEGGAVKVRVVILLDERHSSARLSELRHTFPRLLNIQITDRKAGETEPGEADLYLDMKKDRTDVCCQKIMQSLEILDLITCDQDHDYNSEDERIITERLRSLGYL